MKVFYHLFTYTVTFLFLSIKSITNKDKTKTITPMFALKNKIATKAKINDTYAKKIFLSQTNIKPKSADINPKY